MRKAGTLEGGSKKVEQKTLEQRIVDFNQAVYTAIEAHTGDNAPKDKNDVYSSMRQLDKLVHRHDDETEHLSSSDHEKFNNGTKEAREKLTEVFTQFNTYLRNPQAKPQEKAATADLSASTSRLNRGPLPELPTKSKSASPLNQGRPPVLSTESKKELDRGRTLQNTESTNAAREAVVEFDEILNEAAKIASGSPSSTDIRNLNAKFNDFQRSPAYAQLGEQDRQHIKEEFANKIQAINQKRSTPDSSPTVTQKTANVGSKTSTQEEGNRLSFALSAKYDDLLMRANNLNLKGGTETEKQQLHADYQKFTAQADFQALKGSIKDGFIKSMDKLLPPIPQAVSAPLSSGIIIGTKRQRSPASSTIQADAQSQLSKEASALLERVQEIGKGEVTPEKIGPILNDYFKLQQSPEFKNAKQEAKDQFVQKFEGAIKEMSEPRQTNAASQKEPASAKAQADNRSSVRESKLDSPPPKRVPPVFQAAMDQRAEKKLNSQKDSVSPTRTSRSGSVKGP